MCIMNELKSKLEKCSVKVINPLSAINDIYQILKICYEEDGKRYCSRDYAKAMCEKWENTQVLFMAYNQDNDLLGFAVAEPKEDWVSFEILKVPKKFQNLNVIETLVVSVVNYFFKSGLPYKYIKIKICFE